MIENIMEVLVEAPPWLWFIAVIGGMTFAGVFNIPLRNALLSEESNTRGKALRYDAMNFLVFYMTFVAAGNGMLFLETGDYGPFVLNTAAFWLYSAAFWLVMQIYMHWKGR